jgi:hypothetical protein
VFHSGSAKNSAACSIVRLVLTPNPCLLSEIIWWYWSYLIILEYHPKLPTAGWFGRRRVKKG